MSYEHGPDCDEEYCEDIETEPACDASEHEWSGEGMGGCDPNPGVWSLGGTTLLFKSRCELCGVIRTERLYGSQRNPNECDEVTYEAAE